MKKLAKARAVARAMNVLMVGSPCLIDVAIAAGTIRAYASRLRTEDQQKYEAAIHLPFTSAVVVHWPNMLVRSELGRSMLCAPQERMRSSMLSNNRRAIALVSVAASFVLSGCDQSINNSGLSEPKLTGMYCDAKGDQEKNCQVGDVILTVAGRERLLCDWAWQVARQPGSDDVLCILRGAPREVRPPIPGGPEK